MLLASASITGPLVTFATKLIKSLGLGGIAVLTASSGVVGVPGTEPTMLFAGFNVFQGHLTLPGIIIAGVVGDMIGASIAYAIGYFGSRELLQRQGRKLHVSQRRLESAHRWFERRGDPVILVSRLIPFVRAVFPYAAGVAEMAYWRFFGFAIVGSIIWISALGVLGREVGRSWQSWRNHLEYADYAAVAILVLGIAYLLLWRRRSARRDEPPAPPPQAPAMDAVSK